MEAILDQIKLNLKAIEAAMLTQADVRSIVRPLLDDTAERIRTETKEDIDDIKTLVNQTFVQRQATIDAILNLMQQTARLQVDSAEKVDDISKVMADLPVMREQIRVALAGLDAETKMRVELKQRVNSLDNETRPLLVYVDQQRRFWTMTGNVLSSPYAWPSIIIVLVGILNALGLKETAEFIGKLVEQFGHLLGG